MNKVYIYCLFKNNTPFYVGKTKNTLPKRERQHQLKYGNNIKIFELDECEDKKETWKFWEQFYIELFKSWGFGLLNQNEGGGGPSFHTEESRLKMKSIKRPGTSEKLKGIKRPDVSERFLGRKLNQETINKISQNKKNHKCYSNPKRGEQIKKSNSKNYEKGSLRNQKISEKLKQRYKQN
jgi:hypothetical protein